MRRKAEPAPAEPSEVAALAEAVRALAEEVRVLTAAIDDIRQELEWTVKELRAGPRLSFSPPAPQLTREPGPAPAQEPTPPSASAAPAAPAVTPSQRDLF